MNSINASHKFCNEIVSSRVWRIKEVVELLSALKSGSPLQRHPLSRALVVMCYAHLEGYVKSTVGLYLKYVSEQRITFSDLALGLRKAHLSNILKGVKLQDMNLSKSEALVHKIVNVETQCFSCTLEALHISNLSFDRFLSICGTLGIKGEVFEAHKDFIDKQLTPRRNEIAHGEETEIGIDQASEMVSKTVDMIRLFGEGLEEAALLRFYVAPAK